MATIIVGGIVGGVSYFSSGVAASILGAALVTAATYVDQQYIYPQLFGREKDDVRVFDQDFSQNLEGVGFHRIYGAHCRVSGTPIWYGTKNQESLSPAGKGGSQKAQVRRVFQPVGVVVGLPPTYTPYGIGIRQIRGEGRVFYDDRLTGGVFVRSNHFTVFWSNATTYAPNNRRLFITDVGNQSPIPFNEIPNGSQITIGNIFLVDNNSNQLSIAGTYTASRGGFLDNQGNQTIELWKSGSAIATVGFSPQNAVLGLGAGQPTFFMQGQSTVPYLTTALEGIEIYAGVDNQGQSPAIIGREGVDNVSAYPGIGYVVFNQLVLLFWGQRLPFSFEFTCYSLTATVEMVVRDIVVRSDMPSNRLSTNRLRSEECLGYAPRGVQSSQQELAPLQQVFDFVLQQDSGVIKFISVENTEIIDIPEEHLGATSGDDVGDDPTVFPASTEATVGSLSLRYKSLEGFLSSGEYTARSAGRIEQGRTSERLDLNVTLRDADAVTIANRLLHESRTNGERFATALPPFYSRLAENDRIRFTKNGTEYIVLIQKVDRGVNDLIEVEGLIRQEQFITPSAAPMQRRARDGAEGVRLSAPIRLVVMDIPALSAEHASRPGVYIAAARWLNYAPWEGASIFASQPINDVDRFSAQANLQTEGVIGTAATVLTSTVADGIDGVETVDVDVWTGELESVPDEELLAGYNQAYLGGEIIGFGTATIQGAPDESTGSVRYRLGNLTRGLRGTGDQAANHVVGEDFVLLTSPGLFFLEFPDTSSGVRKLRAVPPDTAIDGVDTVEFTPTFRTLQPFPPTNLQGAGSYGVEDITLSWDRVTRVPVARPVNIEPDLEPVHRWQFELRTSGDSLLITDTFNGESQITISVGDCPSVEGTDYPLKLRVRQIGVYAIGGWAEADAFVS